MKRLSQLIAATAFSFGLSVGAFAQDADKVNVLFIAVDDLKPAIGAFGDPLAKTPNMDRLAERGTIFTNAHCQQAVCAPSRVSLLTGLRPDTTKVWDLQTQMRAALPDVVTIPGAFKGAGYASVGMGKIFDPRSAGGYESMDEVSWSEPFVYVENAADKTFSYRDLNVVAHIEEVRANTELPPGWEAQLKVIFPDGKPSIDKADVPDEAYVDGAMADYAAGRLEGYAESGEAFFLAVGFQKPHLPFNAPSKYWDQWDRDDFELAEFRETPEGAPAFATQPGWELRNYDVVDEGPIPEDVQLELIHGYYAATSYIDAQVGQLLDALDETGLADNTIIILWGDHGWHLGDHDMWCKHTNYEQATRSPLIIVDPRIAEPVAVNASPVEFVDVYPTLLDLAEIEPPHEMHGASLVPIMSGDADRVKDVAVSQYPRGGGSNSMMGYAYRTDRYRLIQWRLQNAKHEGETDGPVVATELYDYETDPLETRNLATDPDYVDVLEAMQQLAQQHRESVGKPAVFGE
ncbi:MAG: sulfatase [Planctomycetota bacterium]